jgi:hypothetical protein
MALRGIQLMGKIATEKRLVQTVWKGPMLLRAIPGLGLQQRAQNDPRIPGRPCIDRYNSTNYEI